MSHLLVRAVPCLVVPRVGCVVRILDCRLPGGLSLGSSPALVLALGWCSLRIAAVIGGGVAEVGCAVVIGVLLGVGCPARRNILSASKIERKNNLRVGPGGAWLLLSLLLLP